MSTDPETSFVVTADPNEAARTQLIDNLRIKVTSSAAKFCVDCRWYQQAPMVCTRLHVLPLDLVTGKQVTKPLGLNPYTERRATVPLTVDNGGMCSEIMLCGYNARFYEAKDISHASRAD